MLTVVSAFVFCFSNGLMQSHAVVHKTDENILYPVSALGVCIFIFGMVINIHSDNLLLSLRKETERGYKVPYGGFYQYISSPSYFGEVLE